MANNYPNPPPYNTQMVQVRIADISTAGQEYVAPGFRGKITKAVSSLGGAIGTADADLTLKIGGTAVTGGVITVTQSGSAAGDVDSVVPTGANTFTASDSIEVETDGASTNTVPVIVNLWLEPV